MVEDAEGAAGRLRPIAIERDRLLESACIRGTPTPGRGKGNLSLLATFIRRLCRNKPGRLCSKV